MVVTTGWYWWSKSHDPQTPQVHSQAKRHNRGGPAASVAKARGTWHPTRQRASLQAGPLLAPGWSARNIGLSPMWPVCKRCVFISHVVYRGYANVYTHIHIYIICECIYDFIYACVCACLCDISVHVMPRGQPSSEQLRKKTAMDSPIGGPSLMVGWAQLILLILLILMIIIC